jgi:hypothetical protein
MRSPTSIHDRTILQDEPLMSMFLGRLMQGRGSRRSDEAKITNNIADEVEATEGGVSAVLQRADIEPIYLSSPLPWKPGLSRFSAQHPNLADEGQFFS